MRLRKANLNDFETFKPFYEDLDEKYQWLYFTCDCEETSCRKGNEDYKDLLELANEEYENFTLDKFEQHLKHNKVFMIVDKQKIIGTISLNQKSRGIYRILEWSMVEQNDEQKVAILEQIKKSFKIRELEAMAFSSEAKKFLTDNQFQNIEKCFFSLKVEEE